jgi:manganese/zinc/iron transport system substrate-binding protein
VQKLYLCLIIQFVNPLKSIFIICTSLTLLLSCNNGAKNNKHIKVLATTGMVGDAAKQLLGTLAEVEVLMGPGVDPHLYKASQGDMNKLAQADIILYSGHHLEGKMADVLHKIGKNKPVIALSEYIPESRLLKSSGTSGSVDPHLWMDVESWLFGVKGLADTLNGLFPEDTLSIGKNYRSYRDTLEQVHQETIEAIATIPSERRVLITSHDAFRYYGLAYKIEVKGLQGISTVSEYGLQDVSNMVNFIVKRGVKAVFIETSVSEKSLQAVIEGCTAKGHPVKIGGTLYSDAMGKSGTPDGTYPGMIRHNTRLIVNALK